MIMNRSLCLLGLLALTVWPHSLRAQPSVTVPAIVQERIDDETLLVARIQLTEPGIAAVSQFLSQLPYASGSLSVRAANCDRALQKLLAMKVSEVFAIVATRDLPMNGATIIIPAAGGESERVAISDAMKAIWPTDVRVIPAGIIISAAIDQQTAVDAKPHSRLEFSPALGATKGAPVQIAIGLGMDARRVLREFVPLLPAELGNGSIDAVLDGWQWLSLGVTPAPRFGLQLVFQSHNKESAAELEGMIVLGLKSASEDPRIKSFLPKARSLVELLTPKRTGDQIVLSLTDANNDARQLMDDLVAPILAQADNGASQARTVNNLKQLMLAMHNFHDAYKSFPAQATRSPAGQKLLSWRVTLLPYLDQSALYKEFHHDEPWDSEHNLKLVSRMPDVFASSNISREQRAKGMTTYLGAVADKTLFGSPEGIPFKKITDGTSNTIALVDANTERAVIWTQPEDLEVDLKQPLNGLTGQKSGLIRIGICDGSVRGISETIDPETLRRLFQFNDGEVVGDF